MHRATFAILLGLCASVFAQQGDVVRARIRIPGEGNIAEQFDFANWQSLLIDMQLTNDQIAEVKEKVAELNGKRKELFEALKAAKEEQKAIEKKISDTSDALVEQESALHAFIKQRAPLEKQQNYDQRAELLPLIKWLELTDAQVTALMAKLEPLRTANPMKKIEEALASDQAGPLDEAARAERIALLRAYQKFNTEWMKAIRDELTPDQQKKWDLRYRRTRFSIAAPGADL